MAVVVVCRPARGRGGQEFEDEVGESAKDMFVSVRGVESEVAKEKFVEIFGVFSDVQDLARTYHFLH